MIVTFFLSLCLGLVLSHLATRKLEAPVLARVIFSLVTIATSQFLFYLITYGSGVLIGAGLLGPAYDSLSESLLVGSAEVDPQWISFEAFQVGEHTYTYFGLFPALLRIPLNFLAPELFGRWSRLSCALAIFLSWFTWVLILRKRMPEQGSLLPLLLLTIAFPLTAPFLFLTASHAIYHEASLWGFCWTLIGIYSYLALQIRFQYRTLTLLALSAACALLSRVIFGIGLYGLILCEICFKVFRERESNRVLLVSTLLPAAAGGIAQLWYNWKRFGSLFTFIDFRYLAYIAQNETTASVLRATGNFSLQRLPSGIWNYFGFTSSFGTGVPVGFGVGHPVWTPSELYPPEFREYVIPLTFTAIWTLVLFALGVRYLARSGTVREILASLCFLPQFLLICSYYIITERYALDLLPFLFFVGLFSFSSVSLLIERERAFRILFVFLIFFSITSSVTSTLSWIPKSNHKLPKEYKAHWGSYYSPG